MSSGIFTRKAGELIFHDKIQQSSIDFTRFSIGKRSNRSAKEIIIVGIGKVTQFHIILSHRDKQAIQHTSKQKSSEKEANKKRGRIKRQGWSGGEEKERQMANTVMREIGIVMGTSYVDFCVDSPATAPEILLATSWACVGFPRRGRDDAAK